MKLKEGVSLCGLHPAMRLPIYAASQIWNDHGRELVITAAIEDGHSDFSLHPFGQAVDFRTNYFDPEMKSRVYSELAEVLRDYNSEDAYFRYRGRTFQNYSGVYLPYKEPDHIHVGFLGSKL